MKCSLIFGSFVFNYILIFISTVKSSVRNELVQSQIGLSSLHPKESTWVEWVRSAYRCSPVPMFPGPDVPRPDIPQFLYSPVPFFPHEVRPMFPSLCVSHPFASQFLCSPAPLFPSLDISHKWFPVPMFPRDIPQSICSPVPLFPSPHAPQSL